MARERGKTKVILINYFKGGAGKTTLCIHIIGMLYKRRLGQILLMDCDDRCKAIDFFLDEPLKGNKNFLEVNNRLSVYWNPPKPKGIMFKSLKRADYLTYDFIVVDTKSSPAEALCLLGNLLPSHIMIPISESQSHDISGIPRFLKLMRESITEKQKTLENYVPEVMLVPMGLSQDEILEDVSQQDLEDNIKLHDSMETVTRLDIKNAFYQKKYLWEIRDDLLLDTYFYNLVGRLV